MAKLSEKLKVGDKVDIEHSVFNNERGGNPNNYFKWRIIGEVVTKAGGTFSIMNQKPDGVYEEGGLMTFKRHERDKWRKTKKEGTK